MKYKVILIIMLFVIIFSVTSMTSFGLLGNQHRFYDTFQDGNQVPCDKCHANIDQEINMSTENPHYELDCEDCHRGLNINYAIGDPVVQHGEEAHAASILSCQMCHVGDIADITSANETHRPLYEKSNLNEACIICHSGFDKKMNFTRPLYIEYDIVNVNGGFEVQNFGFVSSNNTIIEQTPPGDKHTWSSSDVICFDCHSDVKSALENGGHVPRSDYTTGGMMDQSATYGHEGRRHNFDRSNVTIDSCKSCHLSNSSDFGSGHTHEGHAQLDYHASTTEHCYNCHYNATPGGGMGSMSGGGGDCGPCHQMLKSGNHDQILDSMFSQDFCWYEIDKVCIGCHKSGYPTAPESFDNKTFKVYTEPNTIIDIS